MTASRLWCYAARALGAAACGAALVTAGDSLPRSITDHADPDVFVPYVNAVAERAAATSQGLAPRARWNDLPTSRFVCRVGGPGAQPAGRFRDPSRTMCDAMCRSWQAARFADRGYTMKRWWVRFAVAAGAFVATWVGVGFLQAGLFSVRQARFMGGFSEGWPDSDLTMIADLHRQGAWQAIGGLALLVVVLATLRWTRSGLVAAGAALTIVSLVGLFAMAADALPVVLLVDALVPGHESVDWSPTVSDTEFLASGVGIAVGATFMLAGVQSRVTRRPGWSGQERAASAVVGVLIAVCGTAALAAGSAMNFSALVHLEEVWPTGGLYGLAEDRPVNPLGVFLLLLGATMMAGSFASVRRTSIGAWITAGLWTALAVIAFIAPAIFGGVGNVVTDGLTLLDAWLVVPALTATALGFLTRFAQAPEPPIPGQETTPSTEGATAE